MFRLVANSCSNLKHISFCGFYPSYSNGSERLEEAVLEIFIKCKRLELVDFGHSGKFDSPAVIKGMKNHLPLLRGIRVDGPFDYYVPGWVARNLPWLTLLSLSGTSVEYTGSEILTTVLSKCADLQYLYVTCEYDGENFDQELIDQASARIAEFYWRDYSRYEDNTKSSNSHRCCSSGYRYWAAFSYRVHGAYSESDVADCIAKYLPCLKLLSLYKTLQYIAAASLSVILSNCVNLQYLNISPGCDDYFDQELIDQALAQIGEFHWRGYLRFEDDERYEEDDDDGWSFCNCLFCGGPDSTLFDDEEFYESDDCEWYDDQIYLFKDERSDAFFQNQAKDRRRREFKFRQGCKKDCDLQRRSKCKPLTEYKLPYANDLFVVPV